MPISSSDNNRGKWRRKPRDSRPTNSKRRGVDEEDEDEEEEDNGVYGEEEEDLGPNPRNNLNPNFRQAGPRPEVAPSSTPARGAEVAADGAVRISEFPAVVRRAVNRPHPAMMAFAAAGKQSAVVLENVSHGQLQALSTVPAENASLAMAGDQESSGLFVITPPSIMEGRGVVKEFWNGSIIIVPMHADWFCPTTVNRMERQVVPRFFSGKSVDYTPEKYIDCRNMIVAKYMEHPEKRLLISDCHGMAGGIDFEDMTRIYRFLDHWGIINYCAPLPDHESLNMYSYLREDPTGEVKVPSDALKSIDSLIKFEKPKCRLKAEDVYSPLTSKGDDFVDLEHKIWEKLSESRCNSCSKPLHMVYYQSVKEPDIMLCTDCYHENKFVIGHSSMDFTKADSAKDYTDADGDSWSDQETLLLLEGVELYDDNWSDIAEHVGSKSKAQCIVHFLRMPVEDGLLSNLDVPTDAEMRRFTNEDVGEAAHLSTNGNSSGSHVHSSHLEDRLPFANSENPVMSLVAFLASSVGPRVAAASAHASLTALSKGDGLSPGDRITPNDGPNGEVRDSASYKEENISSQASRSQNTADTNTLSTEKVEYAAKAGLAAAAVKAKLFADHEEREIQRLSANIINHQLKRLELKLKQFAEVETLLMKECEQVEKTRQRIAAERARYLGGPRFGSPGVSSSPVSHPGISPSMLNTNTGISSSNRPTQLISPSSSSAQQNMSGGYNPQMNHPPNMAFMQQQRQPMYYGPRPVMQQQQQPTSSSQSPNTMFSPQGSGQSPLSRPVGRPVQGSSSSHG